MLNGETCLGVGKAGRSGCPRKPYFSTSDANLPVRRNRLSVKKNSESATGSALDGTHRGLAEIFGAHHPDCEKTPILMGFKAGLSSAEGTFFLG
jgi:hypothetical protein